jgi:hypothetical protein
MSMYGKIGLAAAAILFSAVPALADSCGGAPIPPAAIDGAKATEAQVKDAVADFKSFQSASDDWQSCLVKDLARQKAEAAKAKDPKPLDPSITDAVNAKIAGNQRDKEKTGAEINAAIHAYNAAHPKG